MSSRFALTLAVLLQAGCLPLPRAYDKAARHLLKVAVTGDSAALQPLAGSTFDGPGQFAPLLALGDSLRVFASDTVELIGYNVNLGANPHGTLTYELHSPTRAALIVLVLKGKQDSLQLSAFSVYPEASSFAEANRFTLQGKGWQHYAMLVAALTTALISLNAGWLVALTPMPRRWLWVLVALTGAAALTLNWTSGVLSFKLVRLYILSAAMSHAGPAAPWMLTVAVPVGAILALAKRRRFLRQSIGAPTAA